MSPLKGGPVLGAAALILSGCVSAYPRAFTPVVEPPPADAAAFQRDFAACASEVAADESHFRHGWRVFFGVFGGGTGSGGMGAGALPIIIPHRDGERRDENERAVKSAMRFCLVKRGYTVTHWKLVEGAEAVSGQLLSPTRPTAAPPVRPAPSPD